MEFTRLKFSKTKKITVYEFLRSNVQTKSRIRSPIGVAKPFIFKMKLKSLQKYEKMD